MSLLHSFKSLGKTDFSELDLNNIGAWPLLLRCLAALLLCGAVLVLGYFLRVTDLQAELERNRVEETALKEQFTTKARQVNQLEGYKEQMISIESLFAELLQQLPSETEVPSLLDDINSAGLNSGLEFEEIKLLPEVAQPFYIELPIQIRVLGGYHELAAFISTIAGMPRIVTMHDFAIKPIKPIKQLGNMGLVMDILVKTYRYHDVSIQP